MDHIRGAPNHAWTLGKIERWHQALKNGILLKSHYLPGTLEECSKVYIGLYVSKES